MPKFSEDTFDAWRKPPSDTEETKLANSLRLVKEAITEDPILKQKSIEVFAQGSYANDTNVRLNSDIDINVRLNNAVFYDVPAGKTKEDYGYTDSSYGFSEYKNDVYNALVRKFGANDVTRNDKCLTVKERPSRIVTDVVPTLKYNRHENSGTTNVGAKFISDKGIPIICFPLQHIAHGVNKNSLTTKKFKRTTRLFRKIRYKMIDDRVAVSDNITSFLLECLVWNVPNSIFNENRTWTEILRNAIIYLYNNTDEKNLCEKWGEVSELLYLFHSGRKWNRADVNNYLVQMWNYLEF
jgi:hypothetical protein